MRQAVGATVVLLGFAGLAPARACPECAEGIRAEVRRGIYEDRFGPNLAAAALPFGVFLAITALIHPGLPTRRGGATADRGES